MAFFMTNFLIALTIFVFHSPLVFAKTFTFQDVQSRVSQSVALKSESDTLLKKIDQLKSQQFNLLKQAEERTVLKSDEIVGLINSSHFSFPDYCKVSAIIDGNKAAITIKSTLENKTITAHTDTIFPEFSYRDIRGEFKLWSHNANLVLVFDEKGSLNYLGVHGNDYKDSISCPYEAPSKVYE